MVEAFARFTFRRLRVRLTAYRNPDAKSINELLPTPGQTE